MKTFNNTWNYDLNKLPNVNEIIILDLDLNEVRLQLDAQELQLMNNNKSYIVESIEDYERGDYKLYYVNLIMIDENNNPVTYEPFKEYGKISKFDYRLYITNRPINK